MKTPREILLNRHCDAEPKLDAVRENALTTLATAVDTPASRSPFHIAWTLWRELIFPSRRIWAGLAAAWVVLLWLNLPGGGKPPRMVAETLAPDREIQALLREQREMFAQLIGSGEPSPAVPNKMTVPRSEVMQTVTLV